MRPISDILAELNALDRTGKAPYYRPRDAATLLILDRSGADGALRVLMGKRHMRHKFMPGAWVFPGGRVDAADSRVKPADDYEAAVAARLLAEAGARASATRARALAIAAIRETWEEAGILVGTPSPVGPTGEDHDPHDAFAAFRARGFLPSIAAMRFVARAVTPPGRPRRFDTRFFAVPASAVGGRIETGVGPSGELEDVAWVTFAEARARPELPPITKAVLDELDGRLARDPGFGPDHPVPFYRWVRDRFVRTEI